MAERRDPVDEAADEEVDLYDVATWEERTSVDGVAVALHWLGVTTARAAVIALAALILLSLVTQGALGAAIGEPIVTVFVVLSVVPALALAAYVWYADVTTGEPLSLLVTTFVLSILFATFAAVVNSTVSAGLPETFLFLALYFFFVVGPVEETVKWLAIRLHAFRSDRFDAVIDGAVYGAVAGLGFATIENALYIAQSLEGGEGALALIGTAAPTAALRALAGPGHVLYSAFAGYYLGLAKFNPENAGPIVVKGLLIASVLHAAYNTLLMIVPALLATPPWITELAAVVIYIVGFLLIVGYMLYRKLDRYQRVYKEVGASDRPEEVAAEISDAERST